MEVERFLGKNETFAVAMEGTEDKIIEALQELIDAYRKDLDAHDPGKGLSFQPKHYLSKLENLRSIFRSKG